MLDTMEHPYFSESEQDSISGIIHHLDGLEITLAHDRLNKVHLILSLTETPINSAKVRAVWFPELDSQANQAANQAAKKVENTKEQKLLLQNGREYHSVAINEHIELYLWVDLWYAKLMPCTSVYYIVPSETISPVKKLTRTNLVNDFAGTPFEQKLIAFLRKHHPCKKDRKTGNYKLLEVFASNEFVE